MGPLGVLLFFQLILPTPTKEIRLGLIESDPGLVALCDFAIQKARETGVLQKPVVLLNASGCGGEGAANAARLYFEEEVVGIVASRCVEETLEIARLSFFEGIPVLSRVGSSPSLFDNRRNPMLVGAALTSVAGYAKSLKEFMTSHRISALTLVGPVFDPYDGEVPLHVSLREVLRKEAIRTRVFEFDEKSTREAFFDRVDMTSRLVVFVGDRRLSKKFFSRIDLSGAVESGFLLVIVCDESPAVCTSGIRGTVEKTRALVLSFDDQNTQKVSDELDATFPDTKDTGMEQKLATFDSCFAFCFGASLTSSGDGEEFVRNLRGKSVHSLHRRLAFDETPSVLRSYAFSRFDAISGGFVPVLELTSEPTPDCALTELSTCFEMKGRASSNDFWAAKMNLVVSECVFRGDDCRSHLWLYVAAGILGVLLLVAIVFYCYRRRMSLQIYRLHWKVPAKSFKIIDKPSGGKSTSTAKWNKKRAVNSYMLLGSTKAEFVELAQRGRVDFSRDDLELLTELKKASHDNIAKFLGVHYNEGPRFFFVQTFVERATLDDILKNIDVSERKYESRDPGEDGVGDDELSVDMIFKSGFVHDIIKGLTYLHRTIGYHGWLSTHTCMIDANWVLKLTSFGLGRLLHGFNASGQLLVDNIPLTHYVSIAPEHLGGLHYGSVYPLGSQEGDVYSLGIVATQILFDADPFTDAVLLTHEVLKKIATGATTPSAPRVSSPFEESLKDLVLPCYGAPAARPSIRAVSEHFNKVFQKSRGNLVDQMLARNAQYANQLEGTVNQRTAMLQEAQQMSYKLLCELLPKSVADKMRMGISVEPRSYDSATVLFCQICHFQVFLAHSTPEQVIHFLNNVFTLFDRVIEDRDAYKVETTGETYMVASGVPTENEDRHVFIIADIALRIRNATKDYSDYKPPNWNLEVRMGFHCGPLATGVIGLKSPRYCLFGDTVNFASRMQSNGKPGRILISADANRILTHTVGGYITEHRGEVAIKGKGVTDTYWLVEGPSERAHSWSDSANMKEL
ncbi:hypothetical protein QR680_017474 [Steinernema hermaphroditum]|uniref:guanylate cyclase n=1 Tax=Steinernema hermaphroditum TaxID=289476 RepID=A0AA39HGR2_9BILA|nr:hypothetical protein QR680_017474 [Steinernema hermaphroditum]